jgi:hypothetical protein
MARPLGTRALDGWRGTTSTRLREQGALGPGILGLRSNKIERWLAPGVTS